MRRLIRISLALLFCVGIAACAVAWLLDLVPPAFRGGADRAKHRISQNETANGAEATWAGATAKRSANVYEIVLDKFEDGGYDTAVRFMAPIRDLGSLEELRESVRGRGRRALSALRADYDRLPPLDSKPNREQILKKVQLEQSIGFVHMYDGRFLEATSWLERALETSRAPGSAGDDSEPDQGGAGYRRHAARRDRELP